MTTESSPEKQADERRILRIRALTHADARRCLIYLSGYTPEGMDCALDHLNVSAHEQFAAAFDALRAADPDGAPDALIALIEGDALTKILRRASEEDIREALAWRPVGPVPPELVDAWRAMDPAIVPAVMVISADVQVCFWCGTEGTGMRQVKVAPAELVWECANAEACRHTGAEVLDGAK